MRSSGPGKALIFQRYAEIYSCQPQLSLGPKSPPYSCLKVWLLRDRALCSTELKIACSQGSRSPEPAAGEGCYPLLGLPWSSKLHSVVSVPPSPGASHCSLCLASSHHSCTILKLRFKFDLLHAIRQRDLSTGANLRCGSFAEHPLHFSELSSRINHHLRSSLDTGSQPALNICLVSTWHT